MQRRFYLVLCLLILFASCEDKKSAPKKTGTTEIENKAAEDSLSEEKEQEKKEPKEEKRPEGPLIVQEELIPFYTKYAEENPEDKVRILTRFGNIEVELFHNTPLHRANFIFMVKHDYFDDTFFYRVSPGFVIQGGNSDTPETNQKRHYIGDFLIPNEFEAGHRHVRGALSMAKYLEQNNSKASSPYEFFIVQAENGAPHLNNEHTVFGRVTKGMDVVDAINQVKVDQSEWPLQNIYIDMEIID